MDEKEATGFRSLRLVIRRSLKVGAWWMIIRCVQLYLITTVSVLWHFDATIPARRMNDSSGDNIIQIIQGVSKLFENNCMLKATAKRSGVSFFEPDPTLFDAVHKEMRGIAGDEAMFSITVPNADLPVDLGFTQDFDLKLAIGDDGDVVVCGRHWTLFTTVTQPMADFEAAYGILQQTAMVSCAAAAAAEPPPLDIDDSCMPFDKLTYAVVVALEELVDNSCCPNTRVFAWLYAKHLRAADMDFMDLLQTPAIANMASTALDAWFVRHPMFRAQAHEAQDLLITVLDDYTPSRPRYEPYWVSES